MLGKVPGRRCNISLSGFTTNVSIQGTVTLKFLWSAIGRKMVFAIEPILRSKNIEVVSTNGM